MATEAAPHHEVVSNIEQVIANEPEMQATFENTVVTHLEESDSLQNEITRLTDYATRIETGFSDIQSKLDNLTYKDSQEYKDRWQSYHNRYLSLMQTSGDTVKQTLAHLKEFLDVIVPKLESTGSRKEADRYLDEFLTSIGEGAPSVDFRNVEGFANNKSQEFIQLHQDVRSFVVDWKNFLGDGKIKFPVEIQAALDNWKKLERERRELIEKATEAGLLTGGAGFGMAVGAMVSTILLGPTMWFSAAAAGASAVTAGAAKSEVERRKSEATAKGKEAAEAFQKLQDLTKKKDETLGQLLIALESQKTTIEKISQRVSGLDHIWPALVHDVGDLKQYLDRLDDTSATTFRARVDLCKKFYGTLSRALETYLEYRGACA